MPFYKHRRINCGKILDTLQSLIQADSNAGCPHGDFAAAERRWFTFAAGGSASSRSGCGGGSRLR